MRKRTPGLPYADLDTSLTILATLSSVLRKQIIARTLVMFLLYAKIAGERFWGLSHVSEKDSHTAWRMH